MIVGERIRAAGERIRAAGEKDSVQWGPERRDLQLERCYFRLFRSEFCGKKVAFAAIWAQN
jgi:hypothetical protein